jgi:acyl carrier protein
MDTFIAIQRLATDLFGVPDDLLLVARTLRDAGIDSLSGADLIFAIEAQFGISIAAEDLASVRSLRDLAVVVDRLITRRTHCHDE